MLKLLKFDQSYSRLSSVRILRKVDVDRNPDFNRNPDSGHTPRNDLFGNDFFRAKDDSDTTSHFVISTGGRNLTNILNGYPLDFSPDSRRDQDDNQEIEKEAVTLSSPTEARGAHAQRRVSNHKSLASRATFEIPRVQLSSLPNTGSTRDDSDTTSIPINLSSSQTNSINPIRICSI